MRIRHHGNKCEPSPLSASHYLKSWSYRTCFKLIEIHFFCEFQALKQTNQYFLGIYPTTFLFIFAFQNSFTLEIQHLMWNFSFFWNTFHAIERKSSLSGDILNATFKRKLSWNDKNVIRKMLRSCSLIECLRFRCSHFYRPSGMEMSKVVSCVVISVVRWK